VGQSLYPGTHACRHRKQSEVGYGSNRGEESKVESAKDLEEDLLDLAAEGTKALSWETDVVKVEVKAVLYQVCSAAQGLGWPHEVNHNPLHSQGIASNCPE
jgi:hypothetical protein